ncbi:MAG: type II methionyl aminopeptidase [Candidatus Woesearchaeota archaeon]
MDLNEELKQHIEAGKISAEALEYGKSLIKSGASVLQILEQVEEFVAKKNAEIAFPAQLSLNETAAHFCPTKETDVILDKQVCKLDLGVHLNGFVADNALTVDLSGRYSDIVKASQEALKNAVKIAVPEKTLGEIGKTIQEVIESYNLKPIKNLSGHALGQWQVHAPPTIPNFDTKDQTKLEENMVIAIEPFATNGQGMIEELGHPTVFLLEQPKPMRVDFVRKIMNEIGKRKGLPFSEHWLEKKFSPAQALFALKQFDKFEILHKYPPLVERGKGIVSQAEVSVIVKDKPIIITPRDL